MPIFQPFQKIPFVVLLVTLRKFPETVVLPVLNSSFIDNICPLESKFAIRVILFIVLETPFIDISILVIVDSIAMFEALSEFSFKSVFVAILYFPMSMEQPLFECSFVL